MTDAIFEPSRRDILMVATGATAAAGAAATIWPLIAQMSPSASTTAAGAPIEIDLGPIEPGQSIQLFWRGIPVFVTHRAEQEIAAVRAVDVASLIDPQTDAARVKPGHEQWLVVNGTCTHLGCIPAYHEGDYGGWFCHCHGSQYDASGRVRRGPAPRNLALVPYEFLSDTKLQVGA
jgi:ubiquinol-cytochrome c reductase iron-sulfur subunit